MAKTNQKTDAEGMSFEQCLAEIEAIVQAMERGEVPLADSLSRYERGVQLIKRCRVLLAGAEKKIELLTEDEKGELGVEGLAPPQAEGPENEGAG